MMIPDEPSEGRSTVDRSAYLRCAEIVRNELGTTIVFVEQNLDTILATAERCYIMEKGTRAR
jgi:urea transport system ATP-binding protein